MWRRGLALVRAGLEAAVLDAGGGVGHGVAGLPSLRAFAAAAREAAAPAPPSACRALGTLPRGRGLATSSAAAQAEPAAAAAPPPGGEEEEESLEEIRARVFGTHVGNGLRSGRKLLRRPLVGPKVVAWYPDDLVKADPLMPDLEAEKAKMKLDRLRRRGKAPPKKGAGKRSKKR